MRVACHRRRPRTDVVCWDRTFWGDGLLPWAAMRRLMGIDLLDDVAPRQQMVHASMLILLVGVLVLVPHAAGHATARVVCRRPSPGRMHGRHGLRTRHRAGADGNACGRRGTGHLAASRRAAWPFVLGPQAHGRLQCPNKGGADGSVVNGYTCGVVLEMRHSHRAAGDDCE